MTAAAVSPLAPAGFPALPPISGVRLAAFAAGIRYTGRNDLMLVELAAGSTVAGVFTQSTMPGAAGDLVSRMPAARARCARSSSIPATPTSLPGAPGGEVVESTAATAAKLFACDPHEVYIASTGVIGEPPPADRISAALPSVVRSA